MVLLNQSSTRKIIKHIIKEILKRATVLRNEQLMDQSFVLQLESYICRQYWISIIVKLFLILFSRVQILIKPKKCFIRLLKSIPI